MTLKQIAEIRTGYPFRKSPRRVDEDGWLLVQMKDIDANGNLHADRLERIDEPADATRHQLKAGDVLMAARGNRNQAAPFVGVEEAAVPASHLMVLKPREGVSPEYLAWFLNLPETQEQLAAVRRGSSIPFVTVQALGDLAIPVPSMDEQRRIAEVLGLFEKERELMEGIVRKKRILADEIMRGLMSGKLRLK